MGGYTTETVGFLNRASSLLNKKRTAILVVVIVLIAFRLALPHLVVRYIDNQLDEIPGYTGTVGSVSLSLWRGAYVIHDLQVRKEDAKIRVPFFACPRIDLSIDWSELLNFALVGEMRLDSPKLNFVDGPPKAAQKDIDESWQEQVRDFFPVRLNRFEIVDGEVHLYNFSTEPNVNIYAKDLNLVARNLTNSQRVSETMFAEIDFSGTTIGDGKITGDTRMNPLSKEPTFRLTLKVEGVNVVALNKFLEAYARIQAKKGTVALYLEMAAAEGKYKGVARPFIKDLEVEIGGDEEKGILRKMWEALVAGVSEILTARPEDQIATEVPFEGKIDAGKDVDLWATIGGILRNAFIQALLPGIDRRLSIGDVTRAERGEKK